MRGDVKHAIEKIYNMTDSNECDTYHLDSPQRLEKIIMDFCKENHKTPSKISYQVNGGVLIMDGVCIDRICPLLPRFTETEEERAKANYYESMCIWDTEL